MKLKKPNFWDYKKPNALSYLLYPVSKTIEIISRISFTKREKFNKIYKKDIELYEKTNNI